MMPEPYTDGYHSTRGLRVRYSRGIKSDFLMRLVAHSDTHDRHPVLHVQRLRNKPTDRISISHVRPSQGGGVEAASRRQY